MQGVLIVGLLLGQAVPVDVVYSAGLERIRKALEQPPALETTRATDRDAMPVFRLTVHGRTPDSAPWADRATVPSYIRPSYPLYHNEFLFMVTPEAFRASVLYPGAMTTPFGGVGVGVPLMPLLEMLFNQTKAEARRRRDERARAEVRHALADLREARDRQNDVRTVVRGGVEVRMVLVRVSGKDGAPPRRLDRPDFTVLEDGVPQAVTVFTKNTDDPDTTRYELGYTPPSSKPGEKRHIEIRLRGIRKTITYDFVTR